MRIRLILLLAVFGAPPPLAAHSVPLDRESLLACAALGERDARLACYDRLAAETGAQIPETGAEPEAVEAEGQFGLETKRADAKRPAAMDITIASLRKDRFARFIITLDNGQVWRQIDDKYFLWDEKDEYRITRGAFNSFFLQGTRHKTHIRVSRVK